jgi:hypothetical protein
VRGIVDTRTTGELADGVRRADELADGGCDLLVAGADLDPVPGLVVLAAVLGWSRSRRSGPQRARLGRADDRGTRRTPHHPRAGGRGDLLLAGGRQRPADSARRGAGPVGRPADAGAARRLAVTIAAAVLANRMAPGSAAWFLPGRSRPRPAGRDGLAELGRPALLDLGLGLPFGADLARTVLESAVGHLQDRDGG